MISRLLFTILNKIKPKIVIKPNKIIGFFSIIAVISRLYYRIVLNYYILNFVKLIDNPIID